MIMNGKDLVVYRLNQIAKLAMMIIGTLSFIFLMMFMCIAYC